MAPVKMRLLTYNLLKGGHEREAKIVAVIQSVAPDVVVVHEVLEVDHFQQIATALGMSPYLAHSQDRLPLRVGLLSRLPVLDFHTLHLWPVWPSCLAGNCPARERTLLNGFWTAPGSLLSMVSGVVAYASGTHLTSIHPASGSRAAPVSRRLQHHSTWGSSFAGTSAVVGQGAGLVPTGLHPALGAQAAAGCKLRILLPDSAPGGRIYAAVGSSAGAP